MKIQHTFFIYIITFHHLSFTVLHPESISKPSMTYDFLILIKLLFERAFHPTEFFFLFSMNMSKSFTSHMKILKIDINKNYKRFLITITTFFMTVLFEFLTTYNIKIIIWDKYMTWISFCYNYFWVNILASLDKRSYLSWNRGIFWFKIRKVAAKCPRFCSLKLPCVQNREIE